MPISRVRDATTPKAVQTKADPAATREDIAKLAFGYGAMISVKQLQSYIDAAPDQRAAQTFLRQLFPVMYRLQPEAQRLLSRTVINAGI